MGFYTSYDSNPISNDAETIHKWYIFIVGL